VKLLDAIAALRSDASGKAPFVDAATASSAPSERPEDRAERHVDHPERSQPVLPARSAMVVSEKGRTVYEPRVGDQAQARLISS
jgi:hypothetical protein